MDMLLLLCLSFIWTWMAQWDDKTRLFAGPFLARVPFASFSFLAIVYLYSAFVSLVSCHRESNRHISANKQTKEEKEEENKNTIEKG
jgi:hypothetical protein